MDETNFDAKSTDTKQALRVVIAYDDIAAGKRAMRVMGNLGKGIGDAIEFQPLVWSFDLLADADWSAAAAREATQADLLIFATSDASPLPPAVEQWAGAVIWQKRGTAAAVIALLGPKENPDGAGSSRLKTIQTVVHRAGLDFFAPAPHHQLDDAIERIHQCAETATPLLDENLHPQPASRSNSSPCAS